MYLILIFFTDLPSRENLETWGIETRHKILVLDDLLQVAFQSVDVADLFTQISHHLNFSVYFMVQNLFAGGKQFRTISLNYNYFILFKKPTRSTTNSDSWKTDVPGTTDFKS